MIWDSKHKNEFESIVADVFDQNGLFLQKKTISSFEDENYMNEWVKPYRGKKEDPFIIGKFPFKGKWHETLKPLFTNIDSISGFK